MSQDTAGKVSSRKGKSRSKWHPAFCAAAELELRDNREDLSFNREYNLSKEPLQIDLLVIKKPPHVKIKNEIGHLFRQHNVVEYKSPKDSLNIDDFYKTLAYAFLYKSLAKEVDGIPVSQLTLSLVRQGYPREMVKKLEAEGMQIQRQYPGIYYVEGAHIPAQIIATNELDAENHRSLRVLTSKLSEADAREFLAEAKRYANKGDINNINAVLKVSSDANYAVYDALMRRDVKMTDAWKLLMKDDLAEAEARGESRGVEMGKKEMVVSLLKANQTVDFVAKVAKMTAAQVREIGQKAAVL